VPTSRAWVLGTTAVVLALVGIPLGVEEFVLLALAAGALLAAAALVAPLRARRARGALETAAAVPVPEAMVGDEVHARVVLRAPARRLAPLRLEDPGRCWLVSHPGLGGRPEGRAPGGGGGRARRPRRGDLVVAGIPAGGQVVLPVPVPTAARGVVELAGPRLWCEDPLGLFASAVGSGPTTRLLVCPVPVPPGALHAPPARCGGGRPSGAAPRDLPGAPRPAGDELDSLRPYVPGDRLTRLHWQALARSGDLVVREFTSGDVARLTLLVDVRPGAPSASLEAAVSAVAGLGVRALAEGTAVELCTSAGERVLLAPGGAGTRALLRALAMIGPSTPRREDAARWHAYDSAGALWATENVGDAGQVLVTAHGAGEEVLPEALSRRTSVMVVR